MLFVKVSDSSENSTTDEEVIELPVEPEGYILMSTLIAQFPGACGLKFKTEQSSWRGVRVVDDKIYPPGEDKWDEENVYHVTYPKDSKRKGDDLDINSAKSRKIEKKCVDLIVLGIPWKSTDETVKRYFEQYGEVVLCEIKRDASNNSKGFGFVRFKEYDNQCSVLGKKHFIDGRWCDVKIPNSQEPETSRKIFVGRLTESLTSKDLQDHFSKYGQVIDVYIPKPFRAFGFVTFVEAEVARSLCGESHIINGVSVHVSRADPKDDDFEPNGSSAGGYNHHYHQQHGGASNHQYHHTGMTRSQSHYHPANSYSPNGYSSHHRADTSSRSSKPMNQQRGNKSYKQDHHHHHHHDSYDRGMRSGGGSGNGLGGGGGYNHQSNGNGVAPGGGGNMGPNDVTAMMTNMFNPMMAAFIQQLAAQTQQQQQQQSPNPYAPPPPPQAMMDSPAAWNHMPIGNFVPPPNGSGGAPMPPSMQPSSNHYHHSARMKPDKKF